MKYCVKCGAELVDDAVICVKCGRAVAPEFFRQTQEQTDPPPTSLSGVQTAAFVMMILGTVAIALCTFLIGLAWTIPMTVLYYNKIKRGEPISTGFKVCSLLFVSMIGGILMLCDTE